MASIGKAFVNFGVLKCGSKEAVVDELANILRNLPDNERLLVEIEPKGDGWIIPPFYYEFTYRFQRK